MFLDLMIMVTLIIIHQDQHVDVDNNNYIVIDDPFAHEVVDE